MIWNFQPPVLPSRPWWKLWSKEPAPELPAIVGRPAQRCLTIWIWQTSAHAVLRRCRASKSWHSWQVLPSFSSGSIILQM